MSVLVLKAMRTVKLLLLAGIMTGMMLITSACGKKQSAPSAHYEAVLDTLVSSVNVQDTESYLRCFTSDARQAYASSENYDPELAKDLAQKNEDKSLKMQYTTLEHTELDSSGIAKLQSEHAEKYSRRIEVTKAYQLKVEFSSGAEDKQMQLTVFNNGSSWLIEGDVIDNFFDK